MSTTGVQYQLFDRTDGYSAVRGLRETNHQVDLNLLFEKEGDHFRLTVQTADRDLDDVLSKGAEHLVPLTSAQLFSEIHACRRAWRAAIERVATEPGVAPYRLLQEKVDTCQHRDLMDDILSRLALAGSVLYRKIFYPRGIGDEKYEPLRQIGLALRLITRERSLWIRVQTEDFFAPWNLLYSEVPPKLGETADPNGFWGIRHLIDHAPGSSGSLEFDLRPTDPLQISLHVDERIDEYFGVPCVSSIRDLFNSYDQAHIQRESRIHKLELQEALERTPQEDQVMYFCCHGLQEDRLEKDASLLDEGYFWLTDDPSIDPTGDTDNRIRASDIETWMDVNVFANCPLVFLNFCEGGQISSTFYEGFGKQFLGLRASAVIGPQVEVPAIFACEFARRFFSAFFEGGPGNSIGEILLRIRRELLDQMCNPLGLIYSLYRGADVYLANPLPRASD